MQHLVEDVDWAVVLDNAALARACRDRFGCSKPTFADLNRMATRVMSDATCTMRFQGGRSKDLRQVGVNLVPFPRGHFLLASSSDAPSGEGSDDGACASAGGDDGRKVAEGDEGGGHGAGRGAGAGSTGAKDKAAVAAMVRGLFLPSNILCRPEPRTVGSLEMLTGQALSRGPAAQRCMGTAEGVLRAAEKLGQGVDTRSDSLPPLQDLDGSMVCAPVFVAGGEFQPDGIPCAAAAAPPPGAPLCASMLCNSLIMAEVFEDIGRRFTERFQRRDGIQRCVAVPHPSVATHELIVAAAPAGASCAACACRQVHRPRGRRRDELYRGRVGAG